MVWVGEVFSPRAPTAGRPKPNPPKARYRAGPMGLEDLGARLRRQAAQVGMDRAEQWVALTDGSDGLDEFMDVNFPRAERILDFYHAAEHLGDLAKAYLGGDAAAAAEPSGDWSHRMKHEGGRRGPGDARGIGPDGPPGRREGGAPPGDRLRAEERPSDGLPPVPGGGLADRLGAHRAGVQDGGEPAIEAKRHAWPAPHFMVQ